MLDGAAATNELTSLDARLLLLVRLLSCLSVIVNSAECRVRNQIILARTFQWRQIPRLALRVVIGSLGSEWSITLVDDLLDEVIRLGTMSWDSTLDLQVVESTSVV